MADLLDPLLMITLWVIGGVIALCGALCYGELGAAMPRAGGEYVFLSKLYHPLFGFLSGWVSFIVGFSAPIAASAIGFSEYFTRAFPQLVFWSDSTGFLGPFVLQKTLSIGVILVFTFIHVRGIKFGAIVQNYLTVLKVGLIVGLILLGLFFGTGDVAHFTGGEAFTFDFGGWKTIGLSLLWIMFAYSGWNASTYIGSEIANPGKNLPRSLILGTGIVILLYLLLNFFYVYAVPPDDMKGVISIGGLAVGAAFGASMETLVSLLISFALFSSLSAFIILGPRVYYSMAKDGYFFKFVSDVHPVFHTPSKAILLQGLISIVMVLSGTFDQILTYMGFSLGIFPVLAVLGVFKKRRSEGRHNPISVKFVVPIIYASAGIIMLVLSLFERPTESSIALLTVFIGIPAFFLFKNKYVQPAA